MSRYTKLTRKYTVRVVGERPWVAIFGAWNLEQVRDHLNAHTYTGATKALVWRTEDVIGTDQVKPGAVPRATFVLRGSRWGRVG